MDDSAIIEVVDLDSPRESERPKRPLEVEVVDVDSSITVVEILDSPSNAEPHRKARKPRRREAERQRREGEIERRRVEREVTAGRGSDRERQPVDQARIDEQLARSLQNEENKARPQHAYHDRQDRGPHPSDSFLEVSFRHGQQMLAMLNPMNAFASHGHGWHQPPPQIGPSGGPSGGSRVQQMLRLASHQGDFGDGDYEMLLRLDDTPRGQQTKRGATQTAINNIPTSFVKKGDEIESCCICISDMEPRQKTRNLQCNHVFHAGCIGKWLKVNKTCPVCKAAAC